MWRLSSLAQTDTHRGSSLTVWPTARVRTFCSENTHNTNNTNNNTRFVERHDAIASEALAHRSSQLARNRREKMSFKFSFK